MKWIFYRLILCALPAISQAQTAFYNNGATLTVSSGATLRVAGGFTNQSGAVTNGGTLSVSGQTTNNGSMNTAASSTLLLNGTAAQTLTGAGTITAKNVVVNNAAGISLAAPLQVDGSFTLTAGLVTASSAAAPLIFTANSTLANTPTDASHVVGYVRKLGTGAFTFPVGSGTKYQPVTVNLSANGSGLTAIYTAGNAGAGTFTTAGSEAAALVSYNSQEYWDLQPVSTATGTVTLYWDGVAETAYLTASRRVAHKAGSAWQNEGGTGSGTTALGSITSNAVSSWGAFAIGSISFPLPVRWLSLTGDVTTGGKAMLRWQVAEENAKSYEVQKSEDGTTYQPVTTIASRGAGTHAYQFEEGEPLQRLSYYRILQKDNEGRATYSSVVRLQAGKSLSSVSLYPNPVVSNALLSVPANLVGTKMKLYNAAGRLVHQYNIIATSQTVDFTNLPNGNYVLQLDEGTSMKISKGM